MSKGKKIIFVLFLLIFISASVYMSFNMISRPTYEFSYTEDYGGTGEKGYVFDGFNGNTSITDVYIDHPYEKVNGEWVQDKSKDVIAVDSYTFVADEYVKYIHIGPTVKHIENEAFVYCKQLRAVYVDEANPYFTDVDGVLYTKDMKEIILYPICRCTHIIYEDMEKNGEITNIGLDVKEEYEVTGSSADELFADLRSQIRQTNGDDFTRPLFDEMLEKGVTAPYIGTYYIIKEKTDSSLKVEKAWSCDEKYTIPEGIEKIAAKAFYKCDRLVEINIPSTVKSIGNMAFFKCYATSLLTLPDGLETIGNDAFSYCENMRYAVFIPESVKKIGHHAFYKCSNDLLYYMGHKDESDIDLGGRWQARSDNSFRADKPLWGKTREECNKYNEELYERDRIEAEKAQANAQPSASSASAGEINTTYVKIIMIFFFIPGFIFIGLQVIRALFKEDFLMTKKGKEKLAKRKEEQEMIHRMYVEGGAEAADGGAQPGETDENGEGGENDE
ncbi:MAG: leucine-rich repeat domain-containing protein [Clostridia bacterium]|nr:leucine-rich repeat domain-containing protein [Clostridia bacterium]